MKRLMPLGALGFALLSTAALAQQTSEAAKHALSPNALPASVDPSIFDPTRPLPRYTEAKSSGVEPNTARIAKAKQTTQTGGAGNGR
jgi:hypothetical protein